MEDLNLSWFREYGLPYYLMEESVYIMDVVHKDATRGSLLYAPSFSMTQFLNAMHGKFDWRFCN